MRRRPASRLRYFEAANREYQDHLDRYADLSPGAASAFAAAIKAAESLVLANPEGFGKLSGVSDVRAVVVPRFPFRLLYLVRGADVIIVAVAHTSRAIERFIDRT